MGKRKAKILICDDDSLIHQSLKLVLSKHYEIASVYNSSEALEYVAAHEADIILLDISMRTKDEGLNAIPLLKRTDPDLAVVMSSGHSDFEFVRLALRNGAADYVLKDISPDDLQLALERVLAHRANLLQRQQQNHELTVYQEKHVLIGQSPPVENLRRMLEKARGSKANVLITGEPGTGKEVAARLLRSTLENGTLAPFSTVDSATIQSSTAESMLFGYERGAFTGAEKTTKGLFEEADSGILYFDELGNMPLDIQAKLLRAIQEKEISRMGSAKKIQLDFRVVAATNRDLDQMAEKQQFRFDLLSRINAIPIPLPPLRERVKDIPLLVEHFLRQQEENGRQIVFLEETMKQLMRYRWPGNVRELCNVVLYVSTMADSDEIRPEDLPPKLWTLPTAPGSEPAKSEACFYERVRQFESQLLQKEYERVQGNIALLARELEMDRSHLYAKLKAFGIHKGK